MTTTLGRRSGNRSAMCSASWRLTPAPGNARCSRPARVVVSSLSARRPPAAESRPSAAAAASVPVPADGSSTTSRAVTLAQAATHQASSSGVENCWKRCCTSSRRVWGGSSRAIRAMRASTPAGLAACAIMAGPKRRSSSVVATSPASYACFHSQAPSASVPPNAAVMASLSARASMARPASRWRRSAAPALKMRCAVSDAVASGGRSGPCTVGSSGSGSPEGRRRAVPQPDRGTTRRCGRSSGSRWVRWSVSRSSRRGARRRGRCRRGRRRRRGRGRARIRAAPSGAPAGGRRRRA